MSHDQKPGRMRVVASPAADAQRRRDDGSDATGTAAALKIADANTASPGATPATSSGNGRLLAGLFVAGCALGGAALPFLRTL